MEIKMNKNELKIAKEICAVGKKMYQKGFVAANDGNISAKTEDDFIIVTPTGVCKGEMNCDMMVKIDLQGKVYGAGKPSSEILMHLEVYRQDPDLKAVCHAHPPISTAFSVAGTPLDKAILVESVVLLGIVPIAEYATPGTADVPNSIKEFVNSYNAVLLSNHGLLTWGESLTQAWFRMESVEHYGKILLYLRQIGSANSLNETQIADLIEIRKGLGIETGGVPKEFDKF